jgi:hypothetical protein
MTELAADQLCLDVTEPEVPPAKMPNADLVGAILDAYRDDYRAAIEALLDDADFCWFPLRTEPVRQIISIEN